MRALEAQSRHVHRLAELRVIEGLESGEKIRSLDGGKGPGRENEKGDGEGHSGCETAPADDHPGILVPTPRRSPWSVCSTGAHSSE